MVNVRVWSLEHFARRLMRYQDERDDAVVVISGKTGTGKSTLAHHLCTTIAKEKGGEFDFESGMFYSKKRLLAAFEEFPERSVLFADEAVNIFFNRDFMNKWQKELVKKINMYRDKFFISFLLIPFFWQLDVALREGQRLKYWVFNDRRGVAYVFEADSQPFTRDPWNARLNSWLLRGWGRRGGRNRNDFVAARSPNFVAKLVYPPLSAEEEERYVRLKALGRRAAAEEELEREEKRKRSYGRIDSRVLVNAIKILVSHGVFDDTHTALLAAVHDISKRMGVPRRVLPSAPNWLSRKLSLVKDELAAEGIVVERYITEDNSKRIKIFIKPLKIKKEKADDAVSGRVVEADA